MFPVTFSKIIIIDRSFKYRISRHTMADNLNKTHSTCRLVEEVLNLKLFGDIYFNG